MAALMLPTKNKWNKIIQSLCDGTLILKIVDVRPESYKNFWKPFKMCLIIPTKRSVLPAASF